MDMKKLGISQVNAHNEYLRIRDTEYTLWAASADTEIIRAAEMAWDYAENTYVDDNVRFSEVRLLRTYQRFAQRVVDIAKDRRELYLVLPGTDKYEDYVTSLNRVMIMTTMAAKRLAAMVEEAERKCHENEGKKYG